MHPWDRYIGEAAGLATSILWTATSVFFNAAARRIGPVAVNATRLVLAVLLHAITYRLLTGNILPSAEIRHVFYLAASGLVGLTLGDQALITSFLYIGPRLGMLIMVTAPLWAALFGWIALGETLPLLAWGGILVTLAGVAWVVLERPKAPGANSVEGKVRGVALALLAAACQAAGLMLSKRGMGHGWLPDAQHLAPQSATLLRMFFAMLFMIPIVVHRAYRGPRGPILPTLSRDEESRRRRAGVACACAGAVVGPYLGVWMSLTASDRAPVAVAQTLCSLPPVLILPLSVWLYGERISGRAVLGALLAVAGVALLVLRPT